MEGYTLYVVASNLIKVFQGPKTGKSQEVKTINLSVSDKSQVMTTEMYRRSILIKINAY